MRPADAPCARLGWMHMPIHQSLHWFTREPGHVSVRDVIDLAAHQVVDIERPLRLGRCAVTHTQIDPGRSGCPPAVVFHQGSGTPIAQTQRTRPRALSVPAQAQIGRGAGGTGDEGASHIASRSDETTPSLAACAMPERSSVRARMLMVGTASAWLGPGNAAAHNKAAPHRAACHERLRLGINACGRRGLAAYRWSRAR